MDTTALIQQVRSLIGQTVNYKGQQHEINEILEQSNQGPALILKCLEGIGTIQGDYHGEAHRRTPELIALPILGEGGTINPFIERLLAMSR